MTLTTPAMDAVPYSKVDAPRTSSTLLASKVSVATTWSGDKADTSITSVPFCKILTRTPSCPRITGADAPPPKGLLCTPSSSDRALPSVAERCLSLSLLTVMSLAFLVSLKAKPLSACCLPSVIVIFSSTTFGSSSDTSAITVIGIVKTPQTAHANGFLTIITPQPNINRYNII